MKNTHKHIHHTVGSLHLGDEKNRHKMIQISKISFPLKSGLGHITGDRLVQQNPAVTAGCLQPYSLYFTLTPSLYYRLQVTQHGSQKRLFTYCTPACVWPAGMIYTSLTLVAVFRSTAKIFMEMKCAISEARRANIIQDEGFCISPLLLALPKDCTA